MDLKQQTAFELIAATVTLYSITETDDISMEVATEDGSHISINARMHLHDDSSPEDIFRRLAPFAHPDTGSDLDTLSEDALIHKHSLIFFSRTRAMSQVLDNRTKFSLTVPLHMDANAFTIEYAIEREDD